MNIRKVAVLGANGTMGCNVSSIFASFGDAKVYMICRTMEDAKKAAFKTTQLVKAEAMGVNLIPMTYDNLSQCIPVSDLVFESVTEDLTVKKDIYNKVNLLLKSTAIIATGTSGLSINDLSGSFDKNMQKRFMGIHMYNPPYSMTLCEVIPSKYTDKNLLSEVMSYLKNNLYRDVVEVKDEPAFMGNRLGFQFINMALQYAEIYKHKGGIDYIDCILGEFTGRNMPPLLTSDFVGLDVHKAIVDNIYKNTDDSFHDTFVMPDFALDLIKQQKFGRKSGCGLYQIVVGNDGTKTVTVYDIETGNYRAKSIYHFLFSKNMIRELHVGNYQKALEYLIDDQSLEAEICKTFLIRYVIYSLVISKEIGNHIHSADIAMATGFNWIPPLAMVDILGGKENFVELCRAYLTDEMLVKINMNEILEDIPKSNYDFRPFLKAKGGEL